MANSLRGSLRRNIFKSAPDDFFLASHFPYFSLFLLSVSEEEVHSGPCHATPLNYPNVSFVGSQHPEAETGRSGWNPSQSEVGPEVDCERQGRPIWVCCPRAIIILSALEYFILLPFTLSPAADPLASSWGQKLLSLCTFSLSDISAYWPSSCYF